VLNKPVLALAYHDKSKALLAQIGTEEYALDVKGLDLHRMKERFALLESEAQSVKKTMAEKIGALRAALDRQYDRVFAMVSASPEMSSPAAPIFPTTEAGGQET